MESIYKTQSDSRGEMLLKSLERNETLKKTNKYLLEKIDEKDNDLKIANNLINDLMSKDTIKMYSNTIEPVSEKQNVPELVKIRLFEGMIGKDVIDRNSEEYKELLKELEDYIKVYE